ALSARTASSHADMTVRAPFSNRPGRHFGSHPQGGAYLDIAPARTSGGGAPVSKPAILARVRVVAPCRRLALQWQGRCARREAAIPRKRRCAQRSLEIGTLHVHGATGRFEAELR